MDQITSDQWFNRAIREHGGSENHLVGSGKEAMPRRGATEPGLMTVPKLETTQKCHSKDPT